MKSDPDGWRIDAAKGSGKPIGCGHVDPLLTADTLEKMVCTCLEALEAHKDNFDCIAVTGYSSTIIGAIVAGQLGKNINIVRKDDENSHSPWSVEGAVGVRYIFIDDLVASARTLKRVHEKMKLMQCKLYGVYLYLSGEYHRGTEARLESETELGVKFLNSPLDNA